MKCNLCTRLALLIILFFSFSIKYLKAASKESFFKVEGKNIQIEFNEYMHSRIIAKFGSKNTIIGDFLPSEYITISRKEVKDFTFTEHRKEKLEDKIGIGVQYILSGKNTLLSKEISIIIYDKFPSMAFFEVKYINKGDSELKVDSWMNNLCTSITIG